MKKWMIVLVGMCFVVAGIQVCQGGATTVFQDDFDGTVLDTSQWSVFVDSHGQYHWPYVAGGFLHSQGYHTRIDSIPVFDAPGTGQSVIARASINLAGAYHKFGFAVNPMERDGPITGYYFDTLSPLDPSSGREHYVRALAWFQPAFGSPINLLNVEIPVTWYEFHEFAIERTPSEVIYSIGGMEVARVTHASGDALPVGVWSDRGHLMLTDWVEVASISAPPLESIVDIDPDTLNLNSKGKWITAYILLPEGYNAEDIDTANITVGDGDFEVGGEYGEFYINMAMVKFPRSEVQDNLAPGEVELIVTGKLSDGTLFEGSDTIRVIDEGGKNE